MATEAAPRTTTRSIPGPRVDSTPDIRPRAGYELLLGVDRVLARLAEPGNTLGLADDLRIALARTAALGDSCRLRPQCDGVRLAADLLMAGDVADARAVLTRMQVELADRQRR